MSGRIFTVSFSSIAVAAAKTIVELSPASNQPIQLIGLNIGASTEFGDAQDETLILTIKRGATTSGTGTAATPQPIEPNDPAADFAAEVNSTAEPSGGTAVVLWNDTFNVRAGYINWFPEGCQPKSVNGSLLCLDISLPADSVTLSGTVWVRELA